MPGHQIMRTEGRTKRAFLSVRVFTCVSFKNHSGSLRDCTSASVGMTAFRVRDLLTNVNISDGVNVCEVRKGDNRKQTG